MTLTGALKQQVESWITDDPDEDTRAELTAVLRDAESGDGTALTDLADRFAGRLEFGTAGLRGAVGAGPNRMNRAVVTATAAGLAAYLSDTAIDQRGAATKGAVVIGYDARHKSDVFAMRMCSRPSAESRNNPGPM